MAETFKLDQLQIYETLGEGSYGKYVWSTLLHIWMQYHLTTTISIQLLYSFLPLRLSSWELSDVYICPLLPDLTAFLFFSFFFIECGLEFMFQRKKN